jgi:hypothetical protein
MHFVDASRCRRLMQYAKYRVRMEAAFETSSETMRPEAILHWAFFHKK